MIKLTNVETSSPDACLVNCGYFSSFLHLKETVTAIAKSEKFVIAHSTHLLDSKRSKGMFGSENQLVQRDVLYCNFKQSKKKSLKTLKTTCTWSVPFTLNFERKEWILQTVCLVHNHHVDDPKIVAGGLILVKLDSQLLACEIDFIAIILNIRSQLCKVRISLRTNCCQCHRKVSLVGREYKV